MTLKEKKNLVRRAHNEIIRTARVFPDSTQRAVDQCFGIVCGLQIAYDEDEELCDMLSDMWVKAYEKILDNNLSLR